MKHARPNEHTRRARRSDGPSGHETNDEPTHSIHRHRRMRHGDVRVALLVSLAEGPAHGYELGQRLLLASGGAWQPSPGSIYPTLQSLADEGLVTLEERDQRRIYTVTSAGLAVVRERAERGSETPWAAVEGSQAGGLRDAVAGLKMAAKQVSLVGNAVQREKAVAIVIEARRHIYELLAKG